MSTSGSTVRDTELHEAVSSNDEERILAILSKNPDLEAKDESGYTPLHLAASKSTEEIVNLLNQSGADIEAQNNNNGCRPLHMALEGFSSVALRALITAGADVTAKTTNGDAPIHYVTANEMEPDMNGCWAPTAAAHEMLRLIVEADPTVVYALNFR